MVRSMTGFGRAEQQIDNFNITVEIKSVNHRYFEFSSRIPRAYQYLEEKLKGLCQNRIARGKVEVFVGIEDADGTSPIIELNEQYAAAYISALKDLSKKFKIKYDISAMGVARNPEIFRISKQDVDADALSAAVLSVADEAITAFITMRTTEGERLCADVKSRVELILQKVEFIEERSPETVKLYRQRIEQKIRELIDSVQVDEQRLLTETAVFADKVAVAEETIRLKSHMQQLCSLLDTDDAVGRKLDFIVQEMNREANTIGSKAQDLDINRAVVDIKSEIEKIREQIQNIE